MNTKHNWLILLGLVSVLAVPTISAAIEIESLGARIAFDDESDVNLNSYEAVVTLESPWEWAISESLELDLEFEGTAGVLSGDGESGGIFHIGFLLELEHESMPVSLVAGSGPTIITEDDFDGYDLGGSIQFTSSIGVRIEIESWAIGYSYQHISNAHIEDSNPGLNMHAISASFEF